MRKLHLVGLTTDQKGLIFTARRGSDSGGYVVALDAEVLNAIAKAQGRPNGAGGPPPRLGGVYTPGPGSESRRRGLLTPREMQARLRAGRSVEDVAEEADVEVEWVERFAVPILAEQAQVVELARTLVYVTPKGDGSSQPLDESVAWNLLDRGARVPDDVFDSSWTAYQLHDQVWMVRFAYRSRGRAQEARWELDVGLGELVARNKVATELGYVEPGARLRRPPPEPAEGTAADAAPADSPRTAKSATRHAAEAVVDDDADDEDEDDLEDDGELQVGPSVDVEGITDDEEEVDGEAGEAEEAVPTPMAAAADSAETLGAPVAGAAPGPDVEPPASEPGPAKAKGRPKPRAKAKKAAPAPAPPATPATHAAPAPVKGVLVSTGRVTRPAPPRGLLVSSPRMRGLSEGVGAGATVPAPKPATSRPAPPKPAVDAPERTTTAAAPAPGPGPVNDPRASRPDSSEQVSPPGGAGVRKAVAQVTSVRVAASRALVARAMLPKPTPPVVSRPTLGGRVNQPLQEAPPVPIRPRPAPPSAPASPPQASRPLRLQPDARDDAVPQVTPLRRPPTPDDTAQAPAVRPTPARSAERPPEPPPERMGDRLTETGRSPFVPRPAPTGRAERPPAARPAAARPPGANPRSAGRPGPGPAPDGGRPQPRQVNSRPEARRPEERRPEERRPNDRRSDDRTRPGPAPARSDDRDGDQGDGRDDDVRGGRVPPSGRPRIAAPPAGDWRPAGGRQRPPDGPPVVAPPTGIDEPRPRRRLRRPPR